MNYEVDGVKHRGLPRIISKKSFDKRSLYLNDEDTVAHGK